MAVVASSSSTTPSSMFGLGLGVSVIAFVSMFAKIIMALQTVGVLLLEEVVKSLLHREALIGPTQAFWLLQLFPQTFSTEYTERSQHVKSGSHPFILMRCTCHTSTRVGWLGLASPCQSFIGILIHCHFLLLFRSARGVEHPLHSCPPPHHMHLEGGRHKSLWTINQRGSVPALKTLCEKMWANTPQKQ